MRERRDDTVAIIPARGGSKGIPGKNLQLVGGRPLVARAVDEAHRARKVGRVVVTTDDEAIAGVAAAAGAEVVVRPSELAGDGASSESALLHALDALAAPEPTGTGFGGPTICVMVQCTSPFVTSDDIDATVALVADGPADSAFTAVPTHVFLWRTGPNGVLGVNHDPTRRARRQDLTPDLVETGGAYAMRVAGLRAAGHRFFGRVEAHEVPRLRALEIDDPADLELARALSAVVDRQTSLDRLPTRPAAVVFDFDGVMTDNRAITLTDGTEGVVIHRGDGYGIEQLRERGVPMLVLSRERDGVVGARCRKLGIDVEQATDDKLPVLRHWVEARGVGLADVVYVGNDLNDQACLAAVGGPVVVADAHPSVLALASVVLPVRGGDGAARAVADLVLERLDRSLMTGEGGS